MTCDLNKVSREYQPSPLTCEALSILDQMAEVGEFQSNLWQVARFVRGVFSIPVNTWSMMSADLIISQVRAIYHTTLTDEEIRHALSQLVRQKYLRSVRSRWTGGRAYELNT